MPVCTRLVLLCAVVACTAAPTTRDQGVASTGPERRVRLAVAGLVHGHVRGFLHSLNGRTDVELVGIAEPDATLLGAALEQYSLPPPPASPMWTRCSSAPGQTRWPHSPARSITRRSLKPAATRHVAVMMEKPLAVSVADGERIRRAARSGNIPVIVNYETTWYPGLVAAGEAHQDGTRGRVHQKNGRHGRPRGPERDRRRPRVPRLADRPVKNGGGALFDFGCYGANLMTWMMDNERPRAVTAMRHQFKPAVYPHVDDEATILVE